MDNKQYNALFSFIWNIANDVLVHAFEKGGTIKIKNMAIFYAKTYREIARSFWLYRTRAPFPHSRNGVEIL